MIATIEGTLVRSTPVQVVIEVNGIGYEINIPVTTAEKLPSLGKSIKLHIVPIYREDTQALYGFHNHEDREFFRLLVEKVSGIGPKMGLSILSKLSVATLKNAIANADVTLLSQCPGIGKKTAERLVVELRDRVFPGGASPSTQPTISSKDLSVEPRIIQDSVAALVTLGYKVSAADKAVRRALTRLGPNVTTETLIKNALD